MLRDSELRCGPVIDVRCVGFLTFEARTGDGFYSAVDKSREGAVKALRDKLPPHGAPVVRFIEPPPPGPA